MADGTNKRGRHAVIFAHPDPTSFNAAIAHTYCKTVRECGQEAILRDLYAVGFDPLLKTAERPDRRNFEIAPDVQAELRILDGCDVVALIYPIWFGLPPAMMKGYLDRVIGAGVSPRQVQERSGHGPLTANHMIAITTSGAGEAWLEEQGQIDALRDLGTRYLFRAFAMKSADHLHIGSIVEGLPQNVVDDHLRDVRERVRKVCARMTEERYGATPVPSIYDGS